MDEDALIPSFCIIDDFWKEFEPELNGILLKQKTASGRWWTTRESKLSLSEVMTRAVLFHESGYRKFRDGLIYIELKLSQNRISRSCFVQALQSANGKDRFSSFPLQKSLSGKTEEVAFIDSIILRECS